MSSFSRINKTLANRLSFLLGSLVEGSDKLKINSNIILISLFILGFVYLLLKKKKVLLVYFGLAYTLFGPFYVIYTRNRFTSYLTFASFEDATAPGQIKIGFMRDLQKLLS